MTDARAAAATLDAATLALARAAAGITLGGAERLRRRFAEVRAAGVPSRWVEELLLQSMLNAGYPLALAAWGVWREVAGPFDAGDAGEPVDHEIHGTWRERGEAACRAVYARTFHKLLLNLRSLHPAVEPMVVVDAYGKVLGRDGLDAARRELCTLAGLMPLDAPRQIGAHLRGVLNLGWTREDVETLLGALADDLGAEPLARVRALWAAVR